MDLNGAMVQVNRLFQYIRPEHLPVREVITEVLKLDLHLMPGRSEIEIGGSCVACPLPNIPEHFAMQFEHPCEIKPGCPARDWATEIFDDGFAKVLNVWTPKWPSISFGE